MIYFFVLELLLSFSIVLRFRSPVSFTGSYTEDEPKICCTETFINGTTRIYKPCRIVCEGYDYRSDRSDRRFLFLDQSAREDKLEVDR